MGTNVLAKLVYGISYSDIPEELQDQVDELLEEGTLDYASPYYDSPKRKWIVGVEVHWWGEHYITAVHELEMAIKEVPSIFKDCDTGFYVSPHVT